jgi:hypothetical protein
VLRTVLGFFALYRGSRIIRRRRTVLAACLSVALGSAALAQSPAAMPLPDAVAATFVEALHQASGAPAQVSLGNQATVRLTNDLMFIPPQVANKLFRTSGRPGYPDMLGLIIGSDGLDVVGPSGSFQLVSLMPMPCGAGRRTTFWPACATVWSGPIQTGCVDTSRSLRLVRGFSRRIMIRSFTSLPGRH